jgi:hypothetical protein
MRKKYLHNLFFLVTRVDIQPMCKGGKRGRCQFVAPIIMMMMMREKGEALNVANIK